ncbi:MAG: S-layer homology domain-containing protein [Clostridia bacterium]|nr:S-layer homology domain-containing protein [Clostridia bacterium]
MKKTRILSVLLALTLVLCMIPFTVSAAAPTVIELDGQRTVFVSSFGKMTYNAKTYTSFKNFNDALSALGKDGGKIVFTGNIAITSFNDIKGREPITIEGIGTKISGNRLDFSYLEGGNVELQGDLNLCFLTLRLAKDAYLFTNGHSVETLDDFDTYNQEHYGVSGADKYTYPDPPSVAPGTVTESGGAIFLNAGVYTTLAAGSVNGKAVNGNTLLTLEGGTVENVVGANIGDGTMNGDAKLVIGKGKIANLVAGSSGGTLNGNVTTVINGGDIASAVIGAQQGAVINGNVVVALNGGNFSGTINAGKGKVTGTKIVITGKDATANIANGAADYIIKLTGGLCEPQFDGTELKGFLFTDKYGVPCETATINGKSVSSASGIYDLTKGTTTVEVASKINVGIQKNATYVAGYSDGTFLPQNNMTRAEAITLLLRVLTDENNIKGKITANYDDVAAGSWYESYIGFFQKLGFLKNLEGKNGLVIYPDQNVTRAEFAELLYQASTLSEASASSKIKSFSDVSSKHKYSAAIQFAVSNNIVTGYEDGTFRPENNITRAEVVTMVNRYMGRTPTGENGGISFSDIDAHWAKGQILAASGAENVTWTATPRALEYQLTGSSAEEYIKGLYEQSATLSGDAIRRGVDTISEKMKQDILNTPNTADIYGDRMTKTTYYISEKNGNDENDGKSPETAWQTMAALNKMRFPQKGTTVLFERGGVYRGTISVNAGMTYGSYGTGPKPIVMQSKKNYADPALWTATEWENVWLCADQLINVGVMGFDHDLQDYSNKCYDETYGLIMNPNTLGVTGPESLNGDLQFYCELPGGSTGNRGNLYLYCEGGNPGERFKSIEIGENIAIISGASNDVVIDNISFKFTGGHGMGGAGGCKDRTITNCVWSWIGGSVLSYNNGAAVTNYGNAIEIYGGCDGYDVINNWMYQIYDTGVTHQRSASTGNCYQGNINYLSNLIEYVFWGIEFYNAPPSLAQLNGGKDTYTRLTENVLSAYNVLRKGGYGWGSITRYRTCQLYCGSTLSDNKNCRSEYNIFDRATGSMLNLPSNSNEVPDKNIYIQHLGYPLGSLKGMYALCDYNAADNLVKHWGDKNPLVVVIDPKRDPVVINTPAGLAKRN